MQPCDGRPGISHGWFAPVDADHPATGPLRKRRVRARAERQRTVDGVAAAVVEPLADVEAPRGCGHAGCPMADERTPHDAALAAQRRARSGPVDPQGRRHRVQVAERIARDPPLPAVRPSRDPHTDPDPVAARTVAAQREVDLRHAVLRQGVQAGDVARADGGVRPDQRPADGVRPSRHGVLVRQSLVAERAGRGDRPRGARLGRGRGSHHDPDAQRDSDAHHGLARDFPGVTPSAFVLNAHATTATTADATDTWRHATSRTLVHGPHLRITPFGGFVRASPALCRCSGACRRRSCPSAP